MADAIRFTSHEQYIAAAPADRQLVLLEIQARVEAVLPTIERCIGYNMPAYRAGKVFFYFAAFKNHLGIYPPVTRDAALIAELSRFRNAKGNLSFRFKEPIPYELIGRVAAALYREYGGELQKK